MIQERVEEYLGAIFRLRSGDATPLPLSQLGDYFGFSPVSIHEMVKKLSQEGWVEYHPYHGVTLTERGMQVAGALVRRHRLWERFLTDVLDIAWDQAHEIAGNLEHAAPESVTERLSHFMGDPQHCPHGAPIPPVAQTESHVGLDSLSPGDTCKVARIFPESPIFLRQVEDFGTLPGTQLLVKAYTENEILVELDGRALHIPNECARAILVDVFC